MAATLDGRARSDQATACSSRGTHQQRPGTVEEKSPARFTVSTSDALTYQGITTRSPAPRAIPSGGQPRLTPAARGSWFSRHSRHRRYQLLRGGLQTMDTAFVPLNALTHPSAWHVQPGTLPAAKVTTWERW